MGVWQGVVMDSLKVLLGFAMSNPSYPCGWTTPEMALPMFQGWPARRASSLRPSSTPLDTPRRMPVAQVIFPFPALGDFRFCFAATSFTFRPSAAGAEPRNAFRVAVQRGAVEILGAVE
jgi:hypothetical protein